MSSYLVFPKVGSAIEKLARERADAAFNKKSGVWIIFGFLVALGVFVILYIFI